MDSEKELGFILSWDLQAIPVSGMQHLLPNLSLNIPGVAGRTGTCWNCQSSDISAPKADLNQAPIMTIYLSF